MNVSEQEYIIMCNIFDAMLVVQQFYINIHIYMSKDCRKKKAKS